MATVTQFWTPGIGGEDQRSPVFQAYGTTLDWTWTLGDDSFYWGFAVRPLQANSAVSVQTPITAVSDNDLNQVTVLTVSVNPGPTHRGRVNFGEGCLLRFTAIKVQTP
jgi:hypothetical protein